VTLTGLRLEQCGGKYACSSLAVTMVTLYLWAHGEFYIPPTLFSNTRAVKYIQNEWFKQRIRKLD
jgi:hypothetical protein